MSDHIAPALPAENYHTVPAGRRYYAAHQLPQSRDLCSEAERDDYRRTQRSRRVAAPDAGRGAIPPFADICRRT